MFKKFFILKQHSDQYQYVYPKNDLFNKVIEEPFLFPCNDIQKYNHDTFVVVLTEISGDQNFLISYYIDNGTACVCFQSNHAWFELMYAAMSVVIRTKLYLAKKRSSLESYLMSLTLLPSPIPGLVIYVPGADPHDTATKVVVPTKTRQKPFSVFVSELRTRLQFEDWLIIFESLLLEKWIVFHSQYLDRVTGCIFAALSLIFPLEWVHLIFPCLSEESVNCLGCPSPYVAGVHSCLIDRVYPLLSNGAVIVDIDQGIVNFAYTEVDSSIDDDRLPKNLMNFLWRSWSNCDMKIVASKRRSPMYSGDEDNSLTQMMNGFLHVVAFLLGKYDKCKIWDSKTERFCLDKVSMSNSRGELFQPFINRLLQSQMVHQFLDDKVNVHPPENEDSLTISLNDIDDFEEACKVMEKWQPDIYTDAIATMASKSKRRINVLANKMLDMTKKTEFTNKLQINDRIVTKTIVSNDSVKLTEPVSVSVTNDEPTTEIMSKNDMINRDNWIKFEDISSKDTKLKVPVKEMTDLLLFDDWGSGGSVVADTSNSCPSGPGNVMSRIIRDFDPLFQI